MHYRIHKFFDSIAGYLLLSVVSSLLISAAYPPFDYDFLAWFGLAPLLFALRKAKLVESAVLSFVAGVLFYTITFYWAGGIVEIGVLNWLLFMVSPLSLYFVAFGTMYRLIGRKSGFLIIIAAPSIWVALEYIRSNLFFLALPWNLLAHSQYRNLTFIQIADITGVYGISFLIVMVNQVFSYLPEIPSIKKFLWKSETVDYPRTSTLTAQIVFVSILLMITASYGWYKQSLRFSENTFRVAVVQPNLLTRDNMSYSEQVAHLDGYARLTDIAASYHPELIVWPASSLPGEIKASRLVRYTITKLVDKTGIPLLAGGAGNEKLAVRKDESPMYSNSEYLISPFTQIEDRYDKIRLLPFNEYLPLRGKVRWPTTIASIRKDFRPGNKFKVFHVADAKFGAPICWENLFPDHFRRFVRKGANLMISATNEGFYGLTAAPYQTLAINVFRAVENRVAIARAATTGVSAFIDPSGRILDRVQDSKGKDLFISGLIVHDLPLSDKKTVYTYFGDIFAYVAIGILLFGFLFQILFPVWKKHPN